jgi:hypothetical protein
MTFFKGEWQTFPAYTIYPSAVCTVIRHMYKRAVQCVQVVFFGPFKLMLKWAPFSILHTISRDFAISEIPTFRSESSYFRIFISTLHFR